LCSESDKEDEEESVEATNDTDHFEDSQVEEVPETQEPGDVTDASVESTAEDDQGEESDGDQSTCEEELEEVAQPTPKQAQQGQQQESEPASKTPLSARALDRLLCEPNRKIYIPTHDEFVRLFRRDAKRMQELQPDKRVSVAHLYQRLKDQTSYIVEGFPNFIQEWFRNEVSDKQRYLRLEGVGLKGYIRCIDPASVAPVSKARQGQQQGLEMALRSRK